MKQNNKAQAKRPFFAKLLAKQELEVANGFGITNKLLDQLEQTQKYPSDGDDDVAI